MKNYLKVIGGFSLIFLITVLIGLIFHAINQLLPYELRINLNIYGLTRSISYHRIQIEYSLRILISFSYLYLVASLIFLLFTRFNKKYIKIIAFNYIVIFFIFILNHFLYFFFTGERSDYQYSLKSWMISIAFIFGFEIVYSIAFFVTRKYFKNIYSIIKSYYIPGFALAIFALHIVSLLLIYGIQNILWTLN